MKYIIWIIVVALIIWALVTLMGGDATSEDMPSDTPQDGEEVQMMEEEASPDDTADVQRDGTWVVDVAQSTLGWTGHKVVPGGDHSGTFEISEGSFTRENGVVTEGSFTIDMQSLEGDGSGVAGHLRNEDFFEVDTYPTATFVVTGYENDVITGDLTIKDTTAQVSFPVVVSEEDDMLRVTSAFQMDRTQWGLTYGSGSFSDDLGDRAIKDMVDMTLDIVFSPSQS